MRSQEDKVTGLFFNTPKHWHFEELLNKSGLSRPRLAVWLKKFIKQGLIKRLKPKGKMPYYIGISENPEFRNRKRLFAIKTLTESGLLDHLSSLKKAKVVIIFGSFSRADWYDDSDIDIFIYGDESNFEYYKYKQKLKREIQIHSAKTKKDLKKIDKMMPYIISGDFIKGSIEELGVEVNV